MSRGTAARGASLTPTRLARAVNLDMAAAGWTPTVDNYLGRVPKARILEAVREAKGEASAQLIDHLKKPEMAKEAERLLGGHGWLPEPLRTPDARSAEVEGEAGTEPCRRSSPTAKTRPAIRRPIPRNPTRSPPNDLSPAGRLRPSRTFSIPRARPPRRALRNSGDKS